MVNSEVIKEGSYGQVSLIKDTLKSDRHSKLAKVPRNKSILNKAFNFFDQHRKGEVNNLCWANNVILTRAIHLEDLINLPLGLTNEERLYLADIFASISKSMISMYSEVRFKKPNLPIAQGLVLSDMLEVISVNMSAIILSCAADYEISKNIYQGWHTKATEGFNTQALAVEATVLLPLEKRHEIFEEFGRIFPGENGKARQFSRLIASNWNNSVNTFCGKRLIENNLTQEKALSKILEVQQDLTYLTNILDRC